MFLEYDEVSVPQAAKMIAAAGICSASAARSRLYSLSVYNDACERWKARMVCNDKMTRCHYIYKRDFIQDYINGQIEKGFMEIVFDPEKVGFVPQEIAAKKVPAKTLQKLDFMVWQGKKYFRSIDLIKQKKNV